MNIWIKTLIQGSSFLFGLLLAFDFTGQWGKNQLEQLGTSSRDSKTDAEHLAGDWQRIGNDIRSAMTQVEHS